jgi:hypothetical protein
VKVGVRLRHGDEEGVMKRSVPMCFVAVLLIGIASGQEVVVTSFKDNGVVGWTAPSGSVCTIEWAADLTSSQDWSRSWNDISGILMTNTHANASVPMFYRVICNTNPLSMITPYVEEADMKWVRQGFSTSTNCPWGFEHDGVDFQPVSNMAPFRAVCDGTVTELCLRHEPEFDEGEGGMWDVYVEIRYDETWALTYNFEPKTTNMADGIAQLTNITASLLQEVSQGDVIGYLYAADESAHVHFSVLKNGYAFHNGVVACPKPFFTPGARESILNLVTNRFPDATDFCY